MILGETEDEYWARLRRSGDLDELRFLATSWRQRRHEMWLTEKFWAKPYYGYLEELHGVPISYFKENCGDAFLYFLPSGEPFMMDRGKSTAMAAEKTLAVAVRTSTSKS